ncbi:MAG: hypothetical protein IKE81_06905, partial [Clostridia bacterium]|nr:hypothetical protein [Clostridia bacterium]
MKTDVIAISSEENNMEAALNEIDKLSVYNQLSPKDSMSLRLLTEEMLGMMRSITGERTGCFWIEDQDSVFQLHLQVETMMDFSKQEKLLEVSSTGKNEAAKGIMGRIRAFFDPIDWADA